MKIPPFIREWFFYILNSQRNGLTPKALLDQAERKTGFCDWGDWPFLEPMTVLLEALHREAQLNYQGKFVLAHHYHRLLTNLLKLVEDWKRNPEIASVPLQPPIFVVGFPRTGITYLHRLLSLNPDPLS